MRVSVIVCTYSMDLIQDTVACINSLAAQTYENKEILLVIEDNEQLYQELKKLVPPFVRIIINEIPGLSQARNTGILNASGDVLVFIDDDAEADKNYLSNLMNNYHDEKVIGVGGRILPKEQPNYPEELYWIGGFTYKGYPDKRCSVRNVHGCNMSFRKNVFIQAGMFDTSLGRIGRKLVTAEETEFSLRALNTFRDCIIIYDPSAMVFHKNHKYRQNFRYLVKRSYYEGQSKANIEKMHENACLSTENYYLVYLLKNAIPCRIGHILKCRNIIQNARELVLLAVVISSVGMGYASRIPTKWVNLFN